MIPFCLHQHPTWVNFNGFKEYYLPQDYVYKMKSRSMELIYNHMIITKYKMKFDEFWKGKKKKD